MFDETSKKSNRDKILDSTIELLKENGYENVSMRDIASKTGIKASSIYKHFKNKESVLDEVVSIFKHELNKRKINDLNISLENNDPLFVLLHIMSEPLKLLEDPELRDIIKIVTECQYYHKGIRDFLVEEMFEKPLRLIKAVLSNMIEQNLIVQLPLDFLAAELQSIFTASFYRISLDKNIDDINVKDINKAMEMHVKFFLRAAVNN